MLNKKKIIAFIVCLVTILSMSLTAFADAYESGITEKDGVVFKTESDSDEYVSGDTAKFTITVENKNNYTIKDVNIVYEIPANFEITSNDMPKTIDELKAGETKELKFSTVVKSETKAPVDVTKIVIIVVAVVVVLAVAIIAIIILMKKKKASALILVGVLFSGAIASALSTPIEVNAEVKNSDFKRVSVHDPSIVKDAETGTYYIFGSHMDWAKSEDLISWTKFTNNINTDYSKIFGDVWEKYSKTTTNASVRGNLWAPDVIYNETMGKWCMYMSVNGDNHQSVIALLTADKIEGPYEYIDGIVYSGFHDNGVLSTARAEYSDVYKVLGEGADLKRYNNTDLSKINAIDPNVHLDEEGNLWMTYGSWSAGIFQLKLDKTTGLRDYSYTYENVSHKSDAYLGYKVSGGYYNSGEGPYVLKTDDYYYLFISIGNLEASGGYNMRVYRSENVNGPYVDENGKSAICTGWSNTLGYIKDGPETWTNVKKYTSPLGVKLMGAYNMYGVSRIQVAQGHNSAFVDDDGKMYVVYHSRFANSGEGHEVRVHQLFQNEEGWLVAAPYEYSGETIEEKGYSKEDIEGTYDFVIQKASMVYAQNGPSTIAESYFLNAYKTITVNSEEVTLEMRVDFSEDSGKITEDRGIVYAQNVTLNSDGTISGDSTGTWKVTEGANVKMVIDNVEYSGVFLNQQNETASRDMTMTFTLEGGNQCAWGVKDPAKNQ